MGSGELLFWQAWRLGAGGLLLFKLSSFAAGGGGSRVLMLHLQDCSKEVGEVLDTLHGSVLLPLSINVCGQEGACGVLSSRAASRLCHLPRSAPLSVP